MVEEEKLALAIKVRIADQQQVRLAESVLFVRMNNLRVDGNVYGTIMRIQNAMSIIQMVVLAKQENMRQWLTIVMINSDN
jgi:hypothetical protein